MRKLNSLVATVAIIVTTVLMVPHTVEASQKELARTTYKGHTYVVYDGNVSWKKAKTLCEKAGGHLVTITSKEENDVVYDLISKAKRKFAWIGLREVNSEYKWITGEKFNYSKWASGQPDNYYNGAEDYGAFWGRNSWNDYKLNDSELNGYICEIEYKIRVEQGKYELEKGESIDLNCSVDKNGVKLSYKSNNLKVAKVSSKGKVIAVAPGVCKITVKAGNTSRTVKIVVLPNKVKGLKTTNINARNIQLTWDKQATASGYKVYAYDSDLEEYVHVKTVSGGNQNTATITNISGANLKKNTAYKFKIRAFVKDGSKDYCSSDSNILYVKTKK